VSFAHPTQRQDEAERTRGYARLVRRGHDARVEQRGCLERIFLAEIGTDQVRLIRTAATAAIDSPLMS